MSVMKRSDLLVVADVNTIWRARPFIALGSRRKVLGLEPIDVLRAWRRSRSPFRAVRNVAPNEAGFATLTATMLPGWASVTSRIEQPRLWRAALRTARHLGLTPHAVVVTIPHYLPLLQSISSDVRAVYYASDDYRRYAGWDQAEIAALERAMIERADAAVFVSRALAERARMEQPKFAPKIRVSMNATEDRFFSAIPIEQQIPSESSRLGKLQRPILGVVGTVNDRLDFDLLSQCASSPLVGTLLFVGPVRDPSHDQLAALRRHPKCVFVGDQPHASIPAWMHFIDIALIPYKEDEFNRFCSPMRLFDHLATGKPIVATDVCDQIRDFAHVVAMAERVDFVSRVEGVIRTGLHDAAATRRRVCVAHENTWASRAAALDQLLSSL